jgi:flagellar basal-body rod modification protein FlgD
MASTTDAVGSMYTNATAYNPTSTESSSSLDKNGFLKLLTAQVSNQDPNSGQDPNQYFQTISMMTQVEQMTNLASSQAKSNAAQMLGKQVTFLEKNVSYSGVVESVQQSGSNVSLTVSGMKGVDPDTITNIQDAAAAPATGTDTPTTPTAPATDAGTTPTA